MGRKYFWKCGKFISLLQAPCRSYQPHSWTRGVTWLMPTEESRPPAPGSPCPTLTAVALVKPREQLHKHHRMKSSASHPNTFCSAGYLKQHWYCTDPSEFQGAVLCRQHKESFPQAVLLHSLTLPGKGTSISHRASQIGLLIRSVWAAYYDCIHFSGNGRDELIPHHNKYLKPYKTELGMV